MVCTCCCFREYAEALRLHSLHKHLVLTRYWDPVTYISLHCFRNSKANFRFARLFWCTIKYSPLYLGRYYWQVFEVLAVWTHNFSQSLTRKLSCFPILHNGYYSKPLINTWVPEGSKICTQCSTTNDYYYCSEIHDMLGLGVATTTTLPVNWFSDDGSTQGSLYYLWERGL